MEYKIEAYSSTDLSSLTFFLDRVFHLKIDAKEKFVRWKYFSSIHQGNTVTYIARANKQIVGHYTNVPFPIKQKNKTYRSLLCTDMATDPEHRGKGIIRRLSEEVYERVAEEKWEFTIGFSNSSGIKIDKNMAGYGYEIVGKMEYLYKFPMRKRQIDYILQETKNFQESILLNLTSKYLKVKKNKEYLTWRYKERPESHYRIFQIMNKSSIQGYVVVKNEKNKWFVLDIVAESDDIKKMKLIIAAIENAALTERIQIVNYYVLFNTYWRKVFSRLTYIKRYMSGKIYYLTVKKHQKVPKAIFSKDNWILMGGDVL